MPQTFSNFFLFAVTKSLQKKYLTSLLTIDFIHFSHAEYKIIIYILTDYENPFFLNNDFFDKTSRFAPK